MLRKFLKHEFKETAGVIGIMVIVVFVFTIIGMLSFQTPMWQALFNMDQLGSGFAATTAITTAIGSVMLYVIMICGALYGTYVYLGVRYYRTMFTERGYLTLTLPVKRKDIHFAKFLVASIWILLLSALVMSSSFLVTAESLIGIFKMTGEYREINLGTVFQFLEEALEEVRQSEMGGSVIRLCVVSIFAGLVAPFCTVASFFCAVSLGQLSRKYRGLLSIVYCVAILTVTNILSYVINSILSAVFVVTTTDFAAYMDFSVYGRIVVNLLVGIILYLVSRHIVINKINLE